MADSAGTIYACAACYMPARLKCGRCGVARYCNAQCQRSHWAAHKKVCGNPVRVRVVTGADLLAEYEPRPGDKHYITKGAVRGLVEDYRRAFPAAVAVELAGLDSAPFELSAGEWHDYWVNTLSPGELKKLSDRCRKWLESCGEKLPDL